MRSFMVVVWMALLVWSSSTRAQNRPNFLLLAIDDLNTCVGFMAEDPGSFLQVIYPDPSVRAQVAKRLSPNLDKLAASGRVFTNAHTNSPLCGPARTSMLTGRMTHASRYHQHSTNFRVFPATADAITLPQRMRMNGYFTAGVGKVFHGSRARGKQITPENDFSDQLNSWDFWLNNSLGYAWGDAEPSKYSPRKGNSLSFGAGNQPIDKSPDYLNAKFVADLLLHGKADAKDIFYKKNRVAELPNDQPFLLAAGIYRPHRPFIAPKKYIDLFPVKEMTGITQVLMDAAIADAQDLPNQGRIRTHLKSGQFKTIMDQAHELGGDPAKIEAWRELIQAYLGCVAYAVQGLCSTLWRRVSTRTTPWSTCIRITVFSWGTNTEWPSRPCGARPRRSSSSPAPPALSRPALGATTR